MLVNEAIIDVAVGCKFRSEYQGGMPKIRCPGCNGETMEYVDQESISARRALCSRYNTRPVQRGLGDGQCAVRCRHEAKGGRGGGWYGDSWRWLLLRQRRDGGGRVGLRNPLALCQGGQRTSRGIAEGAEGRAQDRQEDVNLLIPLLSPSRTGVPVAPGARRSSGR